MTSRPVPPAPGARMPLWVHEGLDILQRRAGVLRSVVAGVCVAGLITAYLAPGIVPPTWLVGAAVAVAAMLLGLALAIAVDTADLTLRGPRHVKAAGGELVAVLPTTVTPEQADPLAGAVFDARESGAKLILGLAAAGRDGRRAAELTDTLAVALARRDVSVLRLDLASGRQDRPGLFEVLRRGHRLADAVDFEPGGLNLARMGAGRDLSGALAALPDLAARLPRDLDVLLVALPTAASRPSVQAATALNHVLILAERDLTSRVDLIAGLDSLEAVGIAAQVVLLDDVTAARLAPAAPVVVDAPADADAPADPVAPADADAPADAAVADDVATTPMPDPSPVVPDPDPVVPDPDPVVPDPDPVVPDPQRPFEPDPDPEPAEAERARAERARAAERAEAERAEAERAEAERADRERAEAERAEGERAEAADDAERTTRLDPVPVDDPWGPDDDPVHTTAQLAVLIDHLETRDGR